MKDNSNNLALFGGEPVRLNEFRSKPHIDENEIEVVIKLMKEGIFSRFVGSPMPGTREDLIKKSIDLETNDNSSSSSNVTINVNLSAGGSEESQSSAGGNGQALGLKLKAAVLQVLSDEKRVGGMLRGH